MGFAVAAGEVVIVVESESSVDALNHAGAYATTWAGGASAPQLHRLVEVLAGHSVLVVPDRDPAGLRCGHQVTDALRAAGAQVAVLIPDKEGEDARDLLNRHGLSVFTGVTRGSARTPPTPMPTR